MYTFIFVYFFITVDLRPQNQFPVYHHQILIIQHFTDLSHNQTHQQMKGHLYGIQIQTNKIWVNHLLEKQSV